MNENVIGTRKKYAMIDVAKFLCALVILFYHWFSEHGPVFWLFEEALSLYAVCVALYMLISGFLTYDKLSRVTDEKEKWLIVKRQVLRILKIYLLWSVPYLVYTISHWNFAALTFKALFWTVQAWVFSSTFYTIWFMPSLAVGTLLSFLLMQKLPRPIVYTLAVACFLLGSAQMTYSFVWEGTVVGDAVIAFSGRWLGGARGWLFFGFPLVTLGEVFVRYKKKAKPVRAAVFAVMGMVLLLTEAIVLRIAVGGTGIDLCLTMPLAVFLILTFLVSVELPDHPIYGWMRKMSLLIFVSQRLFITVLWKVLPLAMKTGVLANPYLGAVVFCGMTIAFSAAILALSRKMPILKNLY